jgi:hypothetical protein
MCENNKGENHEGKIMENQCNRLCTVRGIICKELLYTQEILSPQKFHFQEAPFFFKGL